jgi:23S rRNA (uracil1939-C5)-methyltransferase
VYLAVARFDQTPQTLVIQHLNEDGRGMAQWPEGHAQAGKNVSVFGALPGETVSVQQTARSREADQARTLDVLQASADRVTPRCPHFGVCGGCVLQHLQENQQIAYKQHWLMEALQASGQVTPAALLPPLQADAFAYRRKGRLSVRRVEKKDKTLVGFRETDPRFVAELRECHVIIPQLGFKLDVLAALVNGLEARRDIPQIEFIAGDADTALIVRHLQPLSEADKSKLAAFGQQYGFVIFLQPGGHDSVHPLAGEARQLAFRLPQWDVELLFKPLDFIQVNGKLNEAMIAHALALLDVQPGERVLDLFCGLGNFTLPLAKCVGDAGSVIGVEGDAGLVARARLNATHNQLHNVQFHAADLSQNLADQPWLKQGFDKLLLDPARAGALEVLKQLPLQQFKRIVYVSCNPISLARDTDYLVNHAGWVLQQAGVMDMFPHTAHVESIAVFEPGQKN